MRRLYLITLIMIICLAVPQLTFAYVVPVPAGDWIRFPMVEDVPVDKTWTINFSAPVDKSTIDSSTIFLEDMDNSEIELSVSEDGKKVTVRKSGNYIPGHPYYMSITDDIKTINGTKLRNPVNLTFTIASETIKVDQSFDNQTLVLKKGETLQITLNSNATGGYRWEYAEPLDGTYLKQTDHCYIINDYGAGSAGNGGRDRWIIQALQTGETSINLVNRQSWVSGPPSITFNLIIKIE